MNIFLLTYILTLINGFFCKYIKDGKRVFCITSGIAYFLIAALRRWDVGGDSYNYKYMFELGVFDGSKTGNSVCKNGSVFFHLS